MNRLIIIFLILCLLTSCNDEKKKIIRRIGVIEKIEEHHKGYGIFELKIYCKLNYKGIEYSGIYTGQFEGGYGIEFKKNDSIIAALYELNDSKLNKIVGLKFYNIKLPLQK